MVRNCFVILFLFASGVQTKPNAWNTGYHWPSFEFPLDYDETYGYLDRPLFELPINYNVETAGTFSRNLRHPINTQKPTTESPYDVVIVVPLRPGLAALPPHMNIKPPDNHDDEVYTCEAILPAPWSQLPTKAHKVDTETPQTNETPPVDRVHSSTPPIEKGNKIQPISPKSTSSPNENTTRGKVSAFDIQGKNNNTEETTTFKLGKTQETSTPSYENKKINEVDKDKGKDIKKQEFSTTISPKQDVKNEQKTNITHSPKEDDNKVKNVEKVDTNKSKGNKNMTVSTPVVQSQKETKNTGPVMDSNNPPVGGGSKGTLVDTAKNVAKGGAVVVGGAVLVGGGSAIVTAGKGVATLGTAGLGVSGGGAAGGSGGGAGGSTKNLPGENVSKPGEQPHQNKPNKKTNEGDKNTKQKKEDQQNNQKKDDLDFDFDDLFNEDDFIDYDKFKIELHSIDNITVIFADKFKRLERVCEWFANNFTNELNNLSKFRNKYFDMARKVQVIREKLGDKMDNETDDVYNKMVEGYNVGAILENELQNFDNKIENIHTIVSHYSDAASIIENESFRMKTYIVNLMLGASGFNHPLYKVVGAVRVLTSVARLRTTDCLSPYIPVYQIWLIRIKTLYLEGIQLERDTYMALSRESYTNMNEWSKVKGKFAEFIKRASKELQESELNLEALRDPIYKCVVNVTKYMFRKFKKILPEIQKYLKT